MAQKTKMYCLPYAGGSAQIYSKWTDALSEYVQVIPLEYSGHGMRMDQPLIDDIKGIAADLVPETEPDSILLGYSLGSAVAVEMAHQLSQEGKKPRALILAGQRPPHLIHRDKHIDFGTPHEAMESIIKMGQIPSDVLRDSEYYSIVERMVYADLTAYKKYSIGYRTDALDIPIWVFYGAEDEDTPDADMAEFARCTTDDCTLIKLEGGHFFGFEGFSTFAEKLKSALREALDDTRGKELPDFAGMGDTAIIAHDHTLQNGEVSGRAAVRVPFPADLSEKVRRMCEGESTSKTAVLTAMLMLTLSRYTKKERAVVCCANASRRLAFIGCDIGEKTEFRQLISCVERSLSKGYFSFARLNRASENRSQQSLGSVCGAVFVDSIQRKESGILDRFDMCWSTAAENGTEYIEVYYDAACFNEKTISGIAEHYLFMLGQAADDTSILFENTLTCMPHEQKLILEHFNNTDAPYKSDRTLSQLLEEQAELTPDAVALVCGERRLTYAQLNRRANKLARLLRDKGLTPNSYAAIITERGIELIVSMYAVLKAGGAYVWIDPTFPEQRKRWLLEDCSARLILLGKVSDDCRTEADNLGIEVINALSEGSYIGDGENLPCVNTPDDVVYNLYTSGTTGKPKGVMITNRGVAYYCTSVRNGEIGRCIRREYESFISVTTPSYAIFANESFIPLSNGMKVIMATEAEKDSADMMNRLMLREHAGCINTTPSRLRFYLNEGSSCEFMKHLKLVMLAGERLTGDMLDEIRRYSPDCRVINGYGASESSMHSALYELNGSERGYIPLGSPTDNSKLYVVDSHMRLVGIGIPGELCIGGPGVAKGYVGNAELTAQKFIQNPFGEGRLYRTGDMARWRPDGNIEGLGRRDSQIKIRGMRVELGEIESVLRKVSGITNAAVLVKKVNGEDSICAYYTSKCELQPNDIRNRLRQTLARHMVPSYIMRLPRFPLNQNGKLDMAQLRELDVNIEKSHVEPETENERLLCGLFEQILGIESVGATDDFFALGGHSLRAVQLVNLIYKQFGCSLSINDVFGAPTVRELAVRISGCERYYDILPCADNERCCASSNQRRMYLINERDTENTSYNVPMRLRINGGLDILRLEQAVSRLIERHESLRTSFYMENGEVYQRVAPVSDVSIPIERIALPMGAEPDEVLLSLVRPFELSKAPLIRIWLAEINENEHFLLLDIHHIITDGKSTNILLQDLFELYEGHRLEPLKSHYNDYSQWLAKQDMSERRRYWLGRFEDGGSVLELPTDYPRQQQPSGQYRSVSAELESSLLNDIKAFCRRGDVTEYMFYLGALMVLLGRYSGQEDITVGSPVSARTHPDTETMTGMFANTLAMRAFPERSKTFSVLLGELREVCLAAYANQDFPFDELVDAASAHRDMSRNPLFDVMLVLQNYDRLSIASEDISISDYESMQGASGLDFTFELIQDDNSCQLRCKYSPELYRQDSVELMVKHYISIIRSALEQPDAPLGELTMLSAEETDKVLHEFNDTAADYPGNSTMVELFEQQAAKTPDKTAVVYEGESLTYAQLNARANSLARRLRSMGVQPDNFVAIIAERSLEMICAIFAVLKSGGAYLPIDPAYPTERISFTIEDSKPEAVLVYKAEINTDIPVIDLDNSEVWEGAPENLETVNKPSDLAYCIYTSGTTGKPKGVMIEHYGVANLREYYMRCHGTGENDRILMFASFAFDTSVSEIVMSLLTGAEMHIVPSRMRTDTDALTQYIIDNEITFATLPPAFLSQANITQLRTLISAGSESSRQLVESLANIPVYSNDYGPTEGTVCATFWKHNTTDPVPDRIPIGKPITNKRIYILQDMTLCGIGVPGELCIAGEGLARGYLNRPELTAERFISNPFGEGRMYRTGDLARWLPDGNIEYLGRIDEQVKIRGFRIELGEIESRLRELSYVRDCAVIARDDSSGERAIYAYIVGDESVVMSDVREALKRTLPVYMIPAYMMQIDAIPVTRNGKLDKRALPKIDGTSGRDYAAPRTETERVICDIFSEILGCGRVGVNDSFFELGGHSLRATRLVNRIEAETSCRIALRDVFGSSTPHELAALVDGGSGERYERIPLAEQREHYPMSSTQKRTFLVCQMDGSGIAYNIPSAYRLYGEVDAERLHSALQAMFDRHEILRTRFFMRDGEPVQQIMPHTAAALECVTDTQTDEGTLVERFMRPFDLGCPPLVRAKLIKRSNGYLLLIDMHHIVGDGMSAATFVSELSALYGGDTLPSPDRQYKDYSEWMRTRELSAQKEYWLGQFSDEIPVLDMPLDYSRPQEQSFKGSRITTEIGAGLYDGIKALSAKTGATEYMIFLAAAMVLLGKYSRQNDIVIGSPISGRTHKDTEGMLGMFINTLAMRGKPDSNKAFDSFLAEVKETCLKAYEHQEYPFEELVEAVEVNRDFSRNPLFDVMLVMQNNEQAALHLDDVRSEVTPTDDTVAKFDLTFNIAESEAEHCYSITLEYCTDLFRSESAELISQHFTSLLGSILSNPRQNIGELSMLCENERHKLLNVFNDTAAEYPQDKTIAELFEQQAARYPDSTAVVYEGDSLTYSQLNARANSLARKLRSMGVQPDDFVAMVTERGLEMVCGILAVLKSGGAYLPIDPEYPAERIGFMLEDSRPKAILTYNAEIDTDIPVIDLAQDEVWADSSEHLETVNKPDNLAYCIYTSGTTGKPKGVMVEHRGVVSMRNYLADLYDVDQADNVLQFANYTFDASVWEMVISLLNGAKLVMVSKDTVADIDKFDRFVKQQNITITLLPPQYYMQSGVSGLRVLTTGGSASNASIVERSSGCGRYINAYGPTENTVLATHWERSNDQPTPSVIPIGKPISNTQIYIMQDMQLCGIGVPGELCITGDGLARGYLNRPELTAERFIENPFGSGKMYRTGDLARLLPDGNIEYLGRIDEQVKLRGFRIEPGEIESKIREIDAVRDCVVIARDDAAGDKAIYAYYVGSEEISVSDVRTALRKSLPEYMIPAYMMQIDSIPVNRSGKPDRKALPDIRQSSEREYIAPKTEAEIAVCDAFAQILGVERVSLSDSFFELGGDSIKSIRLVSKVRERGYELSVRDIMNNGTIGRIAQSAAAGQKNEYPQGEVTGEVIETPILRYFLDAVTAKPEHFNQAMIISVDASQEQLDKALSALAVHHDMLRAVCRSGRFEILGSAENPGYSLECMELRDAENAEQLALAKVQQVQSSLDIENGPLLKAVQFVTDSGSQLFICIHHLAIDGVSWRILLEDLSTALAQLARGEAIALPAKTASFAQWAQLLRDYSTDRKLTQQTAYWHGVIARIDEAQLYRHTSGTGESRVRSMSMTLDGDTTDMLVNRANAAYSTKIDELLLAALGMAVSSLTGMERLAVKLEGHGREQLHKPLDIDRTVGWFTSTYPVILTCSDDAERCITETKDYMRRIPEHGIGYALLSGSRNAPEPNVTFNYLGRLEEAPQETAGLLPTGDSIAAENLAGCGLTLNGLLTGGCISFTLTYDSSLCSEVFASGLLKGFEKGLHSIAELCCSTQETHRTLSDISYISLSTEEIDEFNDMF